MIIQEISPIEDFLLHIRWESGLTGLFDVKPYLESEAFRPLKNPDEFRKIHNGKYFIEWECGADLSADTIQAHLKPALSGATDTLLANSTQKRIQTAN
jgi:hypothetical protein